MWRFPKQRLHLQTTLTQPTFTAQTFSASHPSLNKTHNDNLKAGRHRNVTDVRVLLQQTGSVVSTLSKLFVVLIKHVFMHLVYLEFYIIARALKTYCTENIIFKWTKIFEVLWCLHFAEYIDLNLRNKWNATFRAQLCMALKSGHFRKYFRNIWKVWNGAGDDREDNINLLCKKLRHMKRVKGTGNILSSIKRRDNWIGHISRKPSS